MLGKEITLAIAGNKCDLEKSRVVSLEEAEAYASTVGAKHYSTSAKMNQGLEDLFLDLAKRMCSHSLALALALALALVCSFGFCTCNRNARAFWSRAEWFLRTERWR